jgi:hypothetical protein
MHRAGVEQTGYLIKRSNVVMQVGEQQALNHVVIEGSQSFAQFYRPLHPGWPASHC